ncbi:ABC transporter permease [Paenibacillus melissococcoides]|uniref:Transport permease protein n=1 Tax=Paenibacillus melissococcoides TaxID=2912268 RepID=A0ABM9G974_9BACL|nr:MULTISPECIES: ABC transporter permease [Paenibacillus]MEB9892468.1 ABC transporter permease [Bacillus cereus]CAH8248267.1 ABC transporter permease [Paenibacillus melissococcoides]CAH8717993.1 ABC transporter permease [Paenibacillus melissococcoides]CAH8719128.1 ABC transporter permease [Paenibacillus melissococcoides]GIO78650.1 ABC transporter permease [Paenibacillus dendritiformis]
MSEVIWLIRKTMTETFRNKKNWLVYFGLPVVGVLVSMMLYANNSSGTLRVGMLNLDGNQAITLDAIRFLEGLNQIKVTLMDEAAMKRDIAAGKLDSGIVFGEGFAASVRAGQPEHLDIISVKGAQVTAYVKAMLQSYIGNVAAIGRSAGGDHARFDAIYAAYSQQRFKVTAETLEDTSNLKSMTYQSIGFLVAFMMYSAVSMSEMILKEKENRTFLRLLSGPVSARTYVISNVAVNVVIMLLQITVTLIVMKKILRIDSGIPYGTMIATLFLFALAAISLSLLIVAFSKSSAGAGALQNLIITPSCLLAGCFFPMDIMPDTMRKISHFMPQHWLLDMINKLQQGVPLGSLALNMAILIAFAAVFALIAIFRFGRNNDIRQFV